MTKPITDQLTNQERLGAIMGSNSTDVTLEQTYDWILLTHAYTAPIICIVGFLGNILGSVIFIDMEMRAPITIFMTGLAISNALTLLVYIPFAMLLLSINGQQSIYAYSVMSIIAHVFINTSAISNWLTVTVAIYMLAVVQRICDPFKRITTSRARHINCLVYLLVTTMCGPNYLSVLTTQHHIFPNLTVWTMGAGYLANSSSLLFDFNILVNSALMRLLPSVLLTLVVFIVIGEMRKAVKVSRRIHITDKVEAKKWKSNSVHTLIIRRILLTVLIIFTITESSNGLLMLLAYGSEQFYVLYTRVGHVLTTLALINYGITFLLYSFMSYQFREACKQASCHQVREISY